MQLRADALAAALARRLPAVTWIHGDEPLLVLEAADSARVAIRAQGFDERQVFHVDRSFKADALQAEAGALSLFASRKLLELRFATRPVREHGDLIAGLAANLPDDVRLLVVSPRLDRQVTGTQWVLGVDAHAVVVAVYSIDAAQLPRWIAERLARQKQRVDAATLAMIAERVEGNLMAAHQEIGKLALLFAQGDLPADEVRAAVLNVARYDAFDLADAVLAGDAPRALRSLDGLRAEGQPEPLVLWALTEAIRNLLRLAEAGAQGRPPGQLMRSLRIFPPRDRLYERALRATHPPELRARLVAALQQAADTDRIIKGVAAGDAWKSLERTAMMVTGAPVPLMDATQ